jgi:dUTP pyrophosphatase
VNDGDRIAQLVFQKVEKVNLISVSELTSSERAEGGFGHTGKN